MRSRTSRGGPEWSGGKEIIYQKCCFGHRESFGVTRYCTGTTGKGPGGPPGGATHPGGPHGLKWEGNQPLVGWCAPLGPPLRLGLGTLGEGAPPLALGGHSTPLGRCPPRDPISRAGAPLGVPI